jgi:alanine racemase
MSFTCTIHWEDWRQHLDAIASASARATGAPIVPVIKGNGYGLGQHLLCAEAERLGTNAVAVGTVFEATEVLDATTGDVLVLEPFLPADHVASEKWVEVSHRADAQRVIRTVSSTPSLRALLQGPGPVRIVLEGRTSMWRFGFEEASMLEVLADGEVRAALGDGRLEIVGLSLHEPLAQPADEPTLRGFDAGTNRVREVVRWAGMWQAETQVWKDSTAPGRTVYVSHLDERELAAVAASVPDLEVRARTGTNLWLGDRSLLTPQATVLAVHPVPPGTHVGYRQRVGPKDGTLVVVSGGTAHGIGLTAPTPAVSVRQRVVTAGIGVLDASGRALSPFRWAGKQRWFAEPPHQHHSMIWLPRDCVVPTVGDQVDVSVRFTTTRFDAVR